MFDNILKYLDFLIQQDTQNPPRKIHKDDKLFVYLEKHFSDLGFSVEITDLNDGHVIFYAVLGKPNILFNVHLDTVPVTSGWHHDPFKLTVSNNKAYGRGSCDIKGAAACLMAIAEQRHGDMAVLFTTDEEGANGCCVQSFIDNNDLSQYAQIIVAEPTGSQAVLSHRGYLSAQVEFAGGCGHSSIPIALSSNAIHKSNRWLSKALEYAQSHTSKLNPAGICFNVGYIKGGEKNNMIAEKSSLGFSARVPSGYSSEKIFNAIKAFDQDNTTHWNASMLAPALPAYNQKSTDNNEFAKEFCTKNTLKIGDAVDFWTEAALFSAAKLPAIVLGPGDIKQAHTIDEWVELSQLESTYQIYTKVIKNAH